MRDNITRRRFTTVMALTGIAALSLGACSNDDGGSNAEPVSSQQAAAGADAIETALEKGGEITYWTWTPSGQAQADAFMKAYPNVKVNVVNAGTNTEEYTKLQNAITAGSGAPDVAQVEYYAMNQFIISKSLVNLAEYGFADLKDDYSPGPWGAVTREGAVYGLPQDSGPMALFYNKEVFDAAGVTQAPKTWEEFTAAAKKIHEADPSVYITNDSGDSGFTTSMIWQAGGHPFITEGENVTIQLNDEGSQKWADMWSQLLKDDLISPISGWSNEWYQALNQGKIASLVTGAWMPGTLISSVQDGSGKWRVAPMPTYDGTPANSENGGSAQVVLEQSANKELAAGFLKWLNNSEESIKIFLDSGGFPSTTREMQSAQFLGKEYEYFGGQKINEVLVQGAKDVLPDWNYLPYQVYANSIYGDTVGKAYESKSDIAPALKQWQDALVSYGNDQGFTVTGK